ncbi:glycosyltransferase family 32 protein [Aliivibrio fischeri]|uniref:glycosyltransferase family 32 protein n=1 Tax=Aliivibrio fischeri TaxID=668 RepID=UPI0007C54F72|nr:capsular polysaccharide synthesis protein [Aliivibrio fischeri]
MLTHIIKSRMFEKDFFWLRKRIPFLSCRYNEFYNINIKTHSEILSDSKQTELRAAKNTLERLKSACRHTQNSSDKTIPKKLWLYWNSPLETAPEVVNVSIESWKKLNPNYDVTLLNDDNINNVLGFDFNAVFKLSTVNLGLAMKADILRLYLLSTYGGVWADTTTFCLQPLDTWINTETEKSGFFTFRHKNNKTRPLEAWFIAASKNSTVIKYTLNLFLEHLFKPREHSLMLSNRIKLIGKRDDENERFFSNIVNEAEKKGFMPYFSVGYFFNEALNQENTKDIWKILTHSSNQCVVNNDLFDNFKAAYVSKQTYKKDYQNSPLFKERVRYMKKLLSV